MTAATVALSSYEICDGQCVVVCSRGFSRWEPGPNRVLKVRVMGEEKCVS